MKKVILKESPTEITVEEASHLLHMGGGGTTKPILFAYKSEGKSGWCFLAKLTNCSPYKYGFIAMNYTDTTPRFVGDTMKQALTSAVKDRKVFAFDGVNELAYAILDKF